MTDPHRSHHHLAGAVLMTGIPGTRLDAATREALEHMRPSGVILFRRNWESLEQLRALVAELRALPSAPLIGVDQECGKVIRLGEPFTQFPSARAIARCGDPQLARAVGRALGAELRSAGVDIDFAPVLDVDSNPANPVIGERAFGSTPDEVIRFALPFLAGLREAGILPCGKHFPGHGDTDRDSHRELPVVPRDRATLEATELAPFRAAFAAGLPLLMTAHVLYPALDPDHPATVSPRILGGLLRGELGYGGVLISDDLEMQGISGAATVPATAVRALRAGVDWTLVCNHFDASIRTADAIAAALASGELDRARVASSARRIEALKALPRPAPQPLGLPVAEHLALARRILS